MLAPHSSTPGPVYIWLPLRFLSRPSRMFAPVWHLLDYQRRSMSDTCCCAISMDAAVVLGFCHYDSSHAGPDE
jgi:hypothetical protein